MPQPTKPQLAVYAAFAIAVLLIGARFLRSGDTAVGGAGPVGAATGGSGGDPAGGGIGAPDGSSGAGATSRDDAGAGGGSADGVGSADGAEEAGLLVVDVKGAVRHPGVYRLPPGARALDAVEKAGGMTRRADRLGVNLAARVADGGEVVVPRRGAGGAATPVAGGGGAATPVAGGGGAANGGAGQNAGAAGAPLQLDLNTATAQELEQLDGVGPATAAKIVAYRDQHGGIRSVEELDEVSGIGEAKLAAIRAQLGR